jgi:hypothetical protein
MRYKKATYNSVIGLSQEEQDNQETIEYAHQPQYGEPIEIHGRDPGCLSVDHGSTASPLAAYLSWLPYSHAKNCARSVLGCQDINYLILKGFCCSKKGARRVGVNFCLFFGHNRCPPLRDLILTEKGLRRGRAPGSPRSGEVGSFAAGGRRYRKGGRSG